MDARTRERLPVLPVLVRTVDERRKTHRRAPAGGPRNPARASASPSPVRPSPARSPPARTDKVWVDDPASGKRRDLAMEEDLAFWAWATVEVLRPTGVRIEELLEITHHSLVQYRLPTTGELVPLLQIAPSKTDAERLLVVSPELADVLSAIIRRVRDTTGDGPASSPPTTGRVRLAGARPLAVPAPTRHRAPQRSARGAIRNMLNTALAAQPLTDPATGGPLHFTPHDFRRMFITDAILSRPAAAHRPDHRRPPRHQRHPRLQGRLPRRGHPSPPGVPGPPPSPAPQRGIPRPHRRGMGPSSSATSNAARSPPAPAAARSAPPASTNTPR